MRTLRTVLIRVIRVVGGWIFVIAAVLICYLLDLLNRLEGKTHG